MVDSIDFRNDRSGVSPVIGVILMVAVTVIIAAVIGSSALGLSDEVSDSPPQASFEVVEEKDDWEHEFERFDGTSTNTVPKVVTLQHAGGEDVDPNNIKVEVEGAEAHAYLDGDGYDSVGNKHRGVGPAWYEEETVSSGDETMIASHTANTDYLEETGADFKPSVGEGDRTVWKDWESNQKTSLIAVYGPDKQTDYGTEDGIQLEDGQKLTVTWESGEQSSVLFEHEVGGA